MPFEPEQDERKISTYLDLPKGREIICMDTSAANLVDSDGRPLPDSKDYRIAHVGVLDLNGLEPQDGPCMTFRAADGTSRIYRLWLIQCYRPGYPLAAERRWHPDLGINDAIVGLEDQTAKRRDVLAAWRGHSLIMAHLEKINDRPRKTRQAHVDQAVKAARQLLFSNPSHRPRREDIATGIAREEGFPGDELDFLQTLKSRWGRDQRRVGEKTITMPEILAIARKGCIS